MHTQMQTITENITKIHKIAHKKKDLFYFEFFGVVRARQKSRAYSCSSLLVNTKSFRAKTKWADMSDFGPFEYSVWSIFERSDRTSASKVSYISLVKKESGQCCSRNLCSWDYHEAVVLLLLPLLLLLLTDLLITLW